jgi:hypothetical protein
MHANRYYELSEGRQVSRPSRNDVTRPIHFNEAAGFHSTRQQAFIQRGNMPTESTQWHQELKELDAAERWVQCGIAALMTILVVALIVGLPPWA